MTKKDKCADDADNFGWRVLLGLAAAGGVFYLFWVQGFLEYPAGRFGVVVGCILGYWVASRGAIRRAIASIILCAIGLGILGLIMVLLYRWFFGEFPVLPWRPIGVALALVALGLGLYEADEKK